ncbi:MAG: DUF2752 domain-containing protein [Planctomycetaceae bacterium]|jgi:hypothetical protein|nr:DUF2752 domain-containing protein [Planctomycetaceae bacterium]
MTNRGEISFFIVAGILCATGLVILFLKHPSDSWLMPRCPFHVLTGLYCPGCGSLRAMYYLLHGHFSVSFRYQPLLVPFLLVILFVGGKRIYEIYNNSTVSFKHELLFYKIFLLVICLFFVMRNIPLDSLNRLRPPEPLPSQQISNKE